MWKTMKMGLQKPLGLISDPKTKVQKEMQISNLNTYI